MVRFDSLSVSVERIEIQLFALERIPIRITITQIDLDSLSILIQSDLKNTVAYRT